ncbi:MAG: adaptor protein MecA [Clostridiales bacterium]|nr:adaptor protein MecA [Clostridiales bacterium]
MNIKPEIIIIEKSSLNIITVLKKERSPKLRVNKSHNSLWQFSTLESLTEFCSIVKPYSKNIDSVLYSDGKSYRLKIKTEKPCVKSIANEYGTQLTPTKVQLAYTQEHWKNLLCSNTIETLSRLSL